MLFERTAKKTDLTILPPNDLPEVAKPSSRVTHRPSRRVQRFVLVVNVIRPHLKKAPQRLFLGGQVHRPSNFVLELPYGNPLLEDYVIQGPPGAEVVVPIKGLVRAAHQRQVYDLSSFG